jgi:inhibitor of KinA
VVARTCKMNIIQVGENAVALTISYGSTSDCVYTIQQLYHAISRQKHPAILSMRCGLDCLLVEYEANFDAINFLQPFQVGVRMERPDIREIRVPVCYEEPYGRDLTALSERLDLEAEEIARLHYSGKYEVWMIGFMPGFPYMGGLHPSLRTERKAAPDPQILAGSVAIAEEYVGIYPFDSPGGWHIVGCTPWAIVDYSQSKPWLFDYGMQIQFDPISASEFQIMKGTKRT